MNVNLILKITKMSLITIFDKHCVLRNILFGEIYIYKVLQTFVCRFSMKHKKVSHVKNLTNYIFLFWSLQYRDNSDHLCFSRFRLFHGQLISEIAEQNANCRGKILAWLYYQQLDISLFGNNNQCKHRVQLSYVK